MKLSKKLTDWKTWVCTIIPLILMIVGIGIGIYASNKDMTSTAVVMTVYLLITIPPVLPLGLCIFKCFKKGHAIRGSLSVIFIICYFCLMIISLAKVPKIKRLENECAELYKIVKETPYEDETYEQKFQAYMDKSTETSKERFPFKMMTLGVLGISVVLNICAKPNDINDSDSEKELEQN